ncbi:MAG: response regulator [Polyangia bacterium]
MSSTASVDARSLTILLVDDDDIDVMNVQRALKKAGLETPLYIAGDGVAALELLRSGSLPTRRLLVLLDINMPKMNGIEFLRAIRKDPTLKSLCVVVLTTSNEERDRIEAYQLNVAGYLLKPVTFHNFVEVLLTLNRYWQLMEMP